LTEPALHWRHHRAGIGRLTNYLHRETALLPEINIRETKAAVEQEHGEAMLIGALHGYPDWSRTGFAAEKASSSPRRCRSIATGGYARLMPGDYLRSRQSNRS